MLQLTSILSGSAGGKLNKIHKKKIRKVIQMKFSFYWENLGKIVLQILEKKKFFIPPTSCALRCDAIHLARGWREESPYRFCQSLWLCAWEEFDLEPILIFYSNRKSLRIVIHSINTCPSVALIEINSFILPTRELR